ncbi:acyl-CoA dehydrogenase family protein [Stappia indica]|uniref:acyl-CoA dehydrogenase family protein n=1 Tax=Stappia indica TaxID=538381 RepID=UPI001CD1C67F|nr:acyl-CoA dehydrogenase family protein [Stappia indica]MCA1297946.1 acyl-CoA dehydrogenase family protein [Stappia indica]
MSEDLTLLDDAFARFLERDIAPDYESWVEAGSVTRAAWEKTGAGGFLCPAAPEELGGSGGSFAHDAVIIRRLGLAGFDHFGIALHSAIVAPYIQHYGSPEQKERWLPGLASGKLIGAIAMTEPGAGSDLQAVRTTAVRDGNQYLLNGSKTFITNGQLANLVIVVAKTDPSAGAKGVSLFAVETDTVEGFRRGRNLDKLGFKGNDTSELFFNDMRVPADALIGPEEGQGFYQLMEQLPQERLLVAVQAMAAIERALALTLTYVKERKAFGKRVLDFQNTQFKLAELKTEATIGQVFVNDCIARHVAGQLDSVTASMAKYWTTDLQTKVMDECLQFFGGYGYMNEYPISRLFADARVQRIYAGTNEIMKVLIARSL